MKTAGFLFVILGALALLYGGINYRERRTGFPMDPMSVAGTGHTTVPVPVVGGVVVLICGLALLLVEKRRS